MKQVTTMQEQFQKLIENAYRASKETGLIVEKALQYASKEPLSNTEAEKLLITVIDKLKAGAAKRGDKNLLKSLNDETESIIRQALEIREKLSTDKGKEPAKKKHITITGYNGTQPTVVEPRPTFHRREVVMLSGFVKLNDICLWGGNQRLDIQINQFKATRGRTPDSSELLDIMLSRMTLPGVSEKDQFKIIALAHSIANNGVRKPPIIDTDGTLLDGNRRVTACYYILNSPEFDSDQKKRTENIFVWQLSEYATDDDKRAVEISLNFEPDNKEDWPEYVKAKIIYEDWRTMLALEPAPGAARLAYLRRELANRFGYGNDPYMVNRYIKMVDWAEEFEDHMVNDKQLDKFEVKHQASKYFQYFEELSKGTNPGGVAHVLNQNEPLKHLVFDLLFQNKFKNWTIIRNLKYAGTPEVIKSLIECKEMSETEVAADKVEDLLSQAKADQPETRTGNPNQRIQVFATWLKKLPIVAFRDDITSENLLNLLDALEIVEVQIKHLGLKKGA